MNLLIVLCLSLLLTDAAPPPATTANNSAAWIAILRDYERQHGRDAWSFQELSEARAAVLDPYYSGKALPGWLHNLTILYLQYYPVLFMAIFVIGAWLTWKAAASHRWGNGLFANMLWFVLMWMLLLPFQPDAQPWTVLKYQGTLLREGNGLSYPVIVRDRSRINLAAGVEARLLAERSNGWVQIQLSDGSVGWVPTTAVYVVR